MIKNTLTKFIGLLGWLKLFYEIFSERGLQSYGKQHVEYLMNRYKYEELAALDQLELASQAVKSLSKLLQHRISGYNLERVGPLKDSGYVQVNLFPHPALVSGGGGEKY